MRLAIYAPTGRSFPLILAPECMHPSLDCEHRYGQLRRLGNVVLDETIIETLSHDVSPTTGSIEYVVTSETAARAVEALMERDNLPISA